MAFAENIAAATLLPVETISVALTNAPKSIPILNGIYKLATDIRETSERVSANKTQCEQLSERIDTMIGFLGQRDLSHNLNDAMHTALHRFETFLRRCLEFISTFVETSWFKRIVNNKDYEKKFQDLNRELTQYANDLNFGIGLGNMPMNKKEDENHRPNIKIDELKELQRNSLQRKTPEITEGSPRNGKKSRDTTPVNKNTSHTSSPVAKPHKPAQETIFVSGLWEYQYQQYNQFFGPFQQELVFNPKTRTLQGHGEDNVGQYVLNGSFSEVTGEIEMTQQYQVGTGHPNLNMGHQDVMRLQYNPLKNTFEGVSYSQVYGGYVPGALIEMWLT